jgi:hypothetical protein
MPKRLRGSRITTKTTLWINWQLSDRIAFVSVFDDGCDNDYRGLVALSHNDREKRANEKLSERA